MELSPSQVKLILDINKTINENKFKDSEIIKYLFKLNLINTEISQDSEVLSKKLEVNNDNIICYLIKGYINYNKGNKYLSYKNYKYFIKYLDENYKLIFRKYDETFKEKLEIKNVKRNNYKIFSKYELIKFYKHNDQFDLDFILKLFNNEFNEVFISDNKNYLENKTSFKYYFLENEKIFFNNLKKIKNLNIKSFILFIKNNFNMYFFLNIKNNKLSSLEDLIEIYFRDFLKCYKYNEKNILIDNCIILIYKTLIYHKDYIVKNKTEYQKYLFIKELEDYKSRLKLKENIDHINSIIYNYNINNVDDIKDNNNSVKSIKIDKKYLKRNIDSIFKIYSRKHFNSQKKTLFEEIKNKLKIINIGEFVWFCNDFKIKDSKIHMNFKNLIKLFRNNFNQKNNLNMKEFEILLKYLSKLYYKYIPFFDENECYLKFVLLFKINDFNYVRSLLKKNLNSFQTYGIVKLGKSSKEKKLEKLKEENRLKNEKKHELFKNEKKNPLEYLYQNKKLKLIYNINTKTSNNNKKERKIIKSENRIKFNKDKYMEIEKSKKFNTKFEKITWKELNDMNNNDIKCIFNNNNNFSSISNINNNVERKKLMKIELINYGKTWNSKYLKKCDSFIFKLNNNLSKQNLDNSKKKYINKKNLKNKNLLNLINKNKL